MKPVYSLIVALLSATQADAFGTKGGGNVIVCFDENPDVVQKYNQRIQRKIDLNAESQEESQKDKQVFSITIDDSDLSKITRITSLDLSEAEDSIRGRPEKSIRQPLDLETPDEYVERLVREVFDDVHIGIATQIRWAAAQIPFTESISKLHGIQPQQDFSAVGLIDSEHCVLTNIFVQQTIGAAKNDPSSGKHFLYRDDRLWNHEKMSNLSKAVVYLHEVIYFSMRQKGDKLSDAARKVTESLIIQSPKITYSKLFEDLARLGFSSWTAPQSAEVILKKFALAHLRKIHEELLETVKRSAEAVAQEMTAESLYFRPNFVDSKDYAPIRVFKDFTDGEALLEAKEIDSALGRFDFICFATPFKKVEVKDRKGNITATEFKDVSSEYKAQMKAACDRVSFERVARNMRDRAIEIFEGEIHPMISNSKALSEAGKETVLQIFKSTFETNFPWIDLRIRSGYTIYSVIWRGKILDEIKDETEVRLPSKAELGEIDFPQFALEGLIYPDLAKK